jgi:hypothetical protein
VRDARSLLLLVALGAVSGCAASGEIFAGDGLSRTLGQAPDDDDDAVGDDDDTAIGDDDDTAIGDDDDSVPAGDLATGIDLASISLNQSVQVTLMADDTLDTDVPLVQGRTALLRLHLVPRSDWEPRTVLGSLQWDPGDGSPAVALQTSRFVDGPSTDGDLDSTLNFVLPPEAVRNGATWSVRLLEDEGGGGPGTADRARWPRDGGTETLLAYVPGAVKVFVVPIRYNADGSGRMPDTSDAQLAILSDWMFRIYPVNDVEITVGEPWDLDFSIQPNGSGWGDLLYEMTDLRQARNVPSDTYIYGMFRPTQNAGQFCGGGCVAGLSWRADSPNDQWSRASIGLGFSGEGAAGTMIHEIGHAHGRAHANCGLSDGDPNYPHSEGRLGAWGWDPISQVLMSPDENRDMMGYCTPRWVSDYTWEALLDRVSWVNGSADWANAPPELPWRVIGVGVTGARSVRGLLPVVGTPSGEPVHVDWIDASGSVAGAAQGRFRPFDDIPGGTVLVPEAPAGIVALQIDGEVLPLPR